MKINEFVTWTNEQRPQANQQEQADFGQWLDAPNLKQGADHPINWKQLTSPTKQNTGDEYYWQHQNQLQESSLHFDAKPIEKHQQKQALPNYGEPIFNSPIHQDTMEFIEPQYLADGTLTNPELNNSCIKKFAPLIRELEQAFKQAQIPAATASKISKEQSSQAKEINTLNDSPNNLIQFKNNHLFIQNEQAELTLNMHQFNKQEQKELTQMIQDHLKKKGLILSRLIINGVKQ